jgi:16S rRNA (guanine527-N7)-methyltransferase
MNDAVSRETPPAPPVAQGVFSDALPLAERYAALLAGPGVERGLIGPREAPRLWERHLLNCAVLADGIEVGADVCDLGSGAGLPGLVLAIRRPDLRVTLVEPLLRRTRFLEEAVSELRLGRVEVVRGRAEDLGGTREFSVVTSRAVAPLPRLLRWSMPLVREGGVLLAMKGSSAAEEVAAAKAELAAAGAGRVSVETFGAGLVTPPTTAIRVEATRSGRLGWDVPEERDQRRRSPGSPSSRRKGRRA